VKCVYKVNVNCLIKFPVIVILQDAHFQLPERSQGDESKLLIGSIPQLQVCGALITAFYTQQAVPCSDLVPRPVRDGTDSGKQGAMYN